MSTQKYFRSHFILEDDHLSQIFKIFTKYQKPKNCILGQFSLIKNTHFDSCLKKFYI